MQGYLLADAILFVILNCTWQQISASLTDIEQVSIASDNIQTAVWLGITGRLRVIRIKVYLDASDLACFGVFRMFFGRFCQLSDGSVYFKQG